MARKHFMLDRREIPKSAHIKALWNTVFKICEGFSFQRKHVKCNGQEQNWGSLAILWYCTPSNCRFSLLGLGWDLVASEGNTVCLCPLSLPLFHFCLGWFGGVILLKTYHTDFWLTNNYTIDKINSSVYKQLLGAGPPYWCWGVFSKCCLFILPEWIGGLTVYLHLFFCRRDVKWRSTWHLSFPQFQ